MAWTVRGEYFLTADFGTQRVFQPLKPNANILLLGIRSWFIFYNNPTLTSLFLELWSNSGGSPGKLISTSTSLTKAQMITLSNGVKEPYFSFSSPTGIPLKTGDTYHVVPNGTGYVGTASTHLAWKKAWPLAERGYSANYTPTSQNLGGAPFNVILVGASLS